MNLHLPTRYLLLDRAIATLGSVGIELYPGLQRVRGRAAVRARPAARPLHAAAGREARAPRRDRLRQDLPRGAVPVPRPDGAGARRADRGRVRAQGARRLHGADAARLQPARDRAHRRRRADRLEPDRRLRDRRPARARREPRLGRSASSSRRCSGCGSSGASSAQVWTTLRSSAHDRGPVACVAPAMSAHVRGPLQGFPATATSEEFLHGTSRALDGLDHLRPRERAGPASTAPCTSTAPVPSCAREGRRPDRLREGLQARGEAGRRTTRS